MVEQLRSKRAEEGGFTLIELLIVIIILGILAAIVVFAVGNTRKDSVANSCKTDVKSVELSAEAINTKTGSYPATTDAGTLDASNPLVATTTSTNGALLKTYPRRGDYSLTWDNATAK